MFFGLPITMYLVNGPRTSCFEYDEYRGRYTLGAKSLEICMQAKQIWVFAELMAVYP